MPAQNVLDFAGAHRRLAVVVAAVGLLNRIAKRIGSGEERRLLPGADGADSAAATARRRLLGLMGRRGAFTFGGGRRRFDAPGGRLARLEERLLGVERGQRRRSVGDHRRRRRRRIVAQMGPFQPTLGRAAVVALFDGARRLDHHHRRRRRRRMGQDAAGSRRTRRRRRRRRPAQVRQTARPQAKVVEAHVVLVVVVVVDETGDAVTSVVVVVVVATAV